MNSDNLRMLTAIGQGYAAWLAALAEVGARALRSAAANSGQVAEATADALRAPEEYRGAAFENVLRTAYDAQSRQLHALRGASTLWSMAALHHFDAARRR